ncbi:MAG: hypothetical protein HJJLKODD_01122 [Phycisphaerae bacterium]|nr:hypothetical protein [Phycisphaerae bacterium]
MPKSKDAPALFELFRREEAAIPLSSSEADVPPVHQIESNSALEIDPPAVEQPEPGSITNMDIALQQPASQPALFRFEGDCLHISLNSMKLTITAFLILALLFISFRWGQARGYRSGEVSATERLQEQLDPNSLESLKMQPSQPEVLDGLSEVEAHLAVEQARQERNPLPTTEQGRSVGLNYIWVDTFNTETEAQQAQRYLQEGSVETAVNALVSGKWVLITRAGFDYRIPEEEEQCRQLMAQIKQLGQSYMQAGGRYRFECFAKKRTASDNW